MLTFIKNTIPKPILGRLFFILIASLILSSCGFHLRGNVTNNTVQSVKGLAVYLSMTSQDKALFRQLKRDFQLADILVVDDPSLSSHHLLVLNNSLEKRAVGVDNFGRNNEFELIYGVEFMVNRFDTNRNNMSLTDYSNAISQGELVIDKTILTSHRNLYRDNYDNIGKNAEEASLIDSMRRELSLKIMSQFIASNNELESY